MTYITLTNNITGQNFYFLVEVVNYTQLYARLGVLMEQLAAIENVSPANISHIITETALAA